MADDKDPRDLLAGKNIAVLRGDMSQAALAQLMRDRGWKWSQATVWSIEKGDRPLRVAEAVDLLDVLGRPVGGIEFALLRPSSTSALHSAGRAAHEAWNAVVDAMVTFRRAQMNLSYTYSKVREEGVDLRKGDLGLVESWLAEDALEEAIATANQRWREEGEAPDEDAPAPFDYFKGVDTPMWETVRPEPDHGIDPEAR